QFERYLTNDLWKEIAKHSYDRAEELYQGLRKIPGLEIVTPRESNGVFVKIPQSWVKVLREKYFFYVWDEKTWVCRLMTTWDTTSDDIQGFLKLMESL